MCDPRRVVFGALLMIFVLLVAACGGAPTTTPTSDATSGTEATPGDAATPTPAGPAGEASPGAALPTFDLGALTGGIPGVDSYRTSFSLGGELSYQSVVVTKPVLAKDIQTYDGGQPSQRFLIIGDEVWTADSPDGEFEPVPAELGSVMLMAFDPTLLLGAFASADFANVGANLGTEAKNGVQALHVRIDPTTAAGFAAMPPGSSIDLWVAEAGYLVAWEMSGFEQGQDVSIQVTNVNDPANKVERPS